jgi:mono/diheme cytochrome c family protein
VRRLSLLALLIPLAAGCGGSGGHTTSFQTTSGSTVQRWIQVEHLPKSAVPGAELFEGAGCTACHTYAGSGTSVLGAPDLTAIGTKQYGIRFQVAHLKCPSCVVHGSAMPPSTSLSPAQLHQLAVFLEASRGTD